MKKIATILVALIPYLFAKDKSNNESSLKSFISNTKQTEMKKNNLSKKWKISNFDIFGILGFKKIDVSSAQLKDIVKILIIGCFLNESLKMNVFL